MKFATLLSLASAAGLAVASPVEKRADFCGQWDNQVNGPYTTYNVRIHPYDEIGKSLY